MKTLLTMAVAATLVASAAQAERYIMVTHYRGTGPFWPVVEKGAKDAASALDVDLEYHFAPSGDMADMAALIEAGAATSPDGMIVSLPDMNVLGGVIRTAINAGIPVVTINSGLEDSSRLGALMHIGQPEYDAGFAAGTRALEEGVTNPICLKQEAFNTALVDRCQGYFDALGLEPNMKDVSDDLAEIRARTEGFDAILSTGSKVCELAAAVIEEAGRSVHLSCFDLTPDIISLIDDGKVAFTVDQQQRLQGYMPIVVLHLYNANAGLLPGGNVNSGPGFVDKSNAAAVAAQAGTNR